jgi:hypothetical protein
MKKLLLHSFFAPNFVYKRFVATIIMLLTFATQSVNSQTMGIYESYAIVNINGAGNTFYDLTAATANPDFSGANLGTYNHTQTLVLAGAQNKTFKCSGGNVTGGNTYYRVWLQGGSAPSYTTLSPVMGFVSNDAGGCGGNQTWQTNSATVNLLQGLGVGTYNVEVYTDATGTPATATTASFTATFTVNSVFGDSFNRATLSPGGSPSVTYTSTLATGATATLNASTFLDIVNSTTAGVSYVTGSASSYASPYTTTLSSNTGLVTWTFNMRYNRTTNPSGFISGNYGTAVVLGGTSSTISTVGNGYAVVYGSSGATDPIRLVAYTTGLGGTLTDICTSAANDIANVNNYASVRVTYNPSTNTWSLFVRDDGTTAWVDPISGVTAQKGTSTVNSTYTSSALTTFGYFWAHSSTTAQGSQFDRFNVQVAPATTPILTTPTATVTSSTSATLGATVTNNGGFSLTARGTAYKTTTGVVATDNQLAEGGTSVSAFTHSRTGLTAQTQYFYVGYATNTVPNTGISSEGSFRTWSNPATVQPATFTTTAANSQLVANWGAATFPGSGAAQAGYVVIYSTGTPTLSSANGVAPAAGVGTLINITPTVLPAAPALTTTISALTNGTLYNLLIVPYTWDGTNASTYNYFTTGAKTTTGTPITTAYTWNGGSSGAWSTPANWTPATSVAGPTTGDSVTFNTGGAVSVTSVPTVTLGSITVSTTGTNVTLASPSTGNITITLSNAGTALSIATGTILNLIGNTTSSRTMTLAYSGAGNTATVAGTLNLQTSGAGTANYTATNSTTTINGIFRLSSATAVIASSTSNLVIGAAGEFNVASDGGSLPTATWTAGSTLRVTGIVAATAFGANTVSQTFSNVIWDCASQTSAFVFVSVVTTPSTASISGDLTVNRTNTGSLQIPGSDKASISVTNYTQTGGKVYVSNGSTAARTLSVTGNFTLNQNTTTSSFIISETASVGIHTLNVGGNFTMTAGTITRNAVTANVNFNGTGTQTVSKTGGTITGIVNFVVPSPSIVYFPDTSILDGTTATFNLNSGATLQTANTLGITSSGANGSVQVGSTRTFATGANYVYNSAANQATGNGLPATVNTLTINNTGTSPNNIVTLTAITAPTATANSLMLTAGKLDLNSKQLTIPTGGNVVATSGDFTTTAGPIYFIGTGTVSGTVNFPTVRLSGGVDFGSSSNIVTSMTMETGSFINTNAPTYGNASTLIYNTTGTYGRNLEWSATSGKGYPNHVQIQNGTTVDLSANGFADRAIAGNLNLGLVGAASAGSLSMGATTNKLTVGGNVVIGGNTSGTSTLTLSSAIGGDIYLSGNWDTKTNGVSVSNTRAVFFQGTGTSTVTTIGAASFDYLFINKTSGGIVSLANDMTVNNNLTLNAQLVTNAFKVIIPTGDNVTANVNGWVRGNLQKNFPTGSTFRTFQIGSTTGYTPVKIQYNGATGAGNITVSTTTNDHPQIATSNILPSKSVNRYYTIANSGVTGGSYDANFNFVSADIDSGAVASKFGVSHYTPSTWTILTAGTRASLTTQATGLTIYGDFQVGETFTTWTAGASTTAWLTSGNWSFGVPDPTSNVFVASASFYPEITSTVTINSLDIAASTSLVVKIGNNLTVTDVVSNAGTLTIENNANLKQVNNYVNTGSGSTVVNRDTATLMRQDYVLWSSPVIGQQLQAFSPLTLSTRFYIYDPTLGPTGLYSATSATGNFATGTGYLIRLPNNHPVTPTIWNGTFTGGNANSGNITLSSLTSNSFYAIGNPYPSTIDADAFIIDNSLTSAIYFWRKTNNTVTSSYATYTLAGGVSNSGGDPLGLIPNGVIQVGQGFIAKVPAAASSFAFTNSMRLTNNSNQFFRTSLLERNRYWLNLTNDQGFFGQTMVAYMTGATNGYDPAIDGLYFNDSPNALTSIVDSQEYIIQGRALPFETTDVVALGFKSELAGSYTIALNNFDGLFQTDNQDIYLKDNLTNTTQNLKAGSYTFTTESGVFNNRFEVRYVNLLSVDNPVLEANTVAVYKQNQEIVVNAGKTTLSKVQVYDIRGRLLVEKTNINAGEVRLNAGTVNQVVLVKITSATNEVVTKKVIN